MNSEASNLLLVTHEICPPGVSISFLSVWYQIQDSQEPIGINCLTFLGISQNHGEATTLWLSSSHRKRPVSLGGLPIELYLSCCSLRRYTLETFQKKNLFRSWRAYPIRPRTRELSKLECYVGNPTPFTWPTFLRADTSFKPHSHWKEISKQMY